MRNKQSSTGDDPIRAAEQLEKTVGGNDRGEGNGPQLASRTA
jgi:hypothetical protein